MTITSTDPRPRLRRPLGTSRSGAAASDPTLVEPEAAPVVVAVNQSRASAAAAQAGVRLGLELAAPLVFVHVRRGPSSALGEPYYQRRLDAEMSAGHRALNEALAVAKRAGVPATAELLAGNPGRRVVEFAHLRAARLVVLGSRRRRLGKSVSRDVIRRAERPVLVAGRTAPARAWAKEIAVQRFEDQTVIVTGGGRETGVSHARGFAAEGAKVVIADVLEEECRWLARELGERALFTPLDVTDEEEWAATVHAAEQAFGPVSVLVNNA